MPYANWPGWKYSWLFQLIRESENDCWIASRIGCFVLPYESGEAWLGKVIEHCPYESGLVVVGNIHENQMKCEIELYNYLEMYRG